MQISVIPFLVVLFSFGGGIKKMQGDAMDGGGARREGWEPSRERRAETSGEVETGTVILFAPQPNTPSMFCNGKDANLDAGKDPWNVLITAGYADNRELCCRIVGGCIAVVLMVTCVVFCVRRRHSVTIPISNLCQLHWIVATGSFPSAHLCTRGLL